MHPNDDGVGGATNALAGVVWRLRDLDGALVEAWRAELGERDVFEVSQGPIFDLAADAVISPANSFGFMDGGIDLVYSLHLGWEVEAQVREAILRDFDGELPVGRALIVSTGRDDIPWLISAPTMRVPMRVETSTHAYLAFRAALLAVRAHNARGDVAPIRSVLCPGLATGNGGLAPRLCARQMAYAYDNVVHGDVLRKGGLAAVRQHMWLVGREDELHD